MLQTFTPDNFRSICDRLASADPDLAAIIRAHGYPPMWNRPNTFETLVHFILEQQVSLASALAALNKLKEKLGVITPATVLALSDDELKACYFSRQKTVYVRHLAQSLLDGHLDLTALETMPDEAVRSKLTALKGIGNWTADVYLIFVLQRADIFPLGDLAAVNALRRIKGLSRDARHDSLAPITSGWQPHRTVATMLLWHYYLSAEKPAPQPIGK
jgi:DNA-3-methyladenine glycosylase II